MLKDLFDSALKDLRIYTGPEPERNGQVELRNKWNADPKNFAKEPDLFYRDVVDDSYLYDLAAWHSSGTLYSCGQKVHGFARGTVWDFGGGIGTYSMLVATKKTVDRVYYDDINWYNNLFSRFRFQKHGLEEKIYVGKPLDDEKVDLIIVLDVIEHLADPKAWLEKFTHAAKFGAYMIVNVTSHTSNGQHPMHIMDAEGEANWWQWMKQDWELFESGSPSIWRRK